MSAPRRASLRSYNPTPFGAPLDEMLQRPVFALSEGERQRVVFAGEVLRIERASHEQFAAEHHRELLMDRLLHGGAYVLVDIRSPNAIGPCSCASSQLLDTVGQGVFLR